MITLLLRQRNIIRVYLTIILLTSLPFPFCAQAKSDDKEKLVSSILEVVYGDSKDSILPDKQANKNDSIKLPWSQYYSAVDFSEDYPWIAKHYLRESGDNKLGKWNQNIVIGLGFPNDLKPLNNGKTNKVFLFDHTGIQSPLSKEMLDIFNKTVAYNKSELAKIFPFNFSVKESSRESEAANFRIIFYDEGYWGHPNKNDNQSKSYSSASFPKRVNFASFFETVQGSAIFFTPNLKNQVNGYYLVDQAENIDFAVCYIPTKKSPIVIESLLRECFVRGLGLPYEIKNEANSILSNWQDSGKLMTITSEDKELVREIYRADITSGLNKQQVADLLSKK